MISENYNLFVDTERLDDDSGNTESYIEHIADLPCMIQPLDDSFTQDIDGSFGKDWLMFCDVVDILEGDKIINGTTTYKVVGLEVLEFLGESHMELRIREFNK